MYNRNMSDERRIAALEAQIKTLTARVDDIFEALKFESSSTTKHLNQMATDIVDIRECLNIGFRALYPGAAKDHRKINDILLPRTPRAPKAR